MQDPKHPEPGSGSVGLGIAAGVVAGLVGIGLWMLLYKGSTAGFGILGWLAGPAIGAVVGFAMRQAGRSREPAVSWSAVAITVGSCAVGYVLTDLYLVPWVPPSTLVQAIQHFTSDIQALLLIAVGCYLAFILARRPA